MTAATGMNKFQPKVPTFDTFSSIGTHLCNNSPNILQQGVNCLRFICLDKQLHITPRKIVQWYLIARSQRSRHINIMTGFILNVIWTNDFLHQQSTENSKILRMYRRLNNVLRIINTPIATIFFINVSIKPKVSFIAVQIFFMKIGIGSHIVLDRSPTLRRA